MGGANADNSPPPFFFFFARERQTKSEKNFEHSGTVNRRWKWMQDDGNYADRIEEVWLRSFHEYGVTDEDDGGW